MLRDFGNARGTIICSSIGPVPDDVWDAAQEAGFYISALNPSVYESYSRATFMETLDDWGYFGDPSQRPEWFTGHPWTR